MKEGRKREGSMEGGSGQKRKRRRGGKEERKKKEIATVRVQLYISLKAEMNVI